MELKKERQQGSGVDTIKYHTCPRIPNGMIQNLNKHHKTIMLRTYLNHFSLKHLVKRSIVSYQVKSYNEKPQIYDSSSNWKF